MEIINKEFSSYLSALKKIRTKSLDKKILTKGITFPKGRVWKYIWIGEVYAGDTPRTLFDRQSHILEEILKREQNKTLEFAVREYSSEDISEGQKI